MDDSEVQDHIETLVAEERQLYAAAGREGGHTIDERARLDQVRISLDRYWDLLRQRRAQEEFGLNPDEVSMRSVDTVERFKQ
jgi:chromosome condensin MukBEF MukE localization factor